MLQKKFFSFKYRFFHWNWTLPLIKQISKSQLQSSYNFWLDCSGDVKSAQLKLQRSLHIYDDYCYYSTHIAAEPE